ncbi:hypothetical protein ERX37_03135 [Macrococcus hajekii]|uniref:Uncharacterized protein n=1 Tax=Macrococcus hajekii TaxID=198482 RepID=A0A4R6BMN2_9STAP|nr:hypothetical protein [Macrococcus hajekii]TDM03093.1 hypothetical protein ERX37_03135 [Macrococcus hajekii]GGB06458.1 hypothetical protein GCM10007190_13200 [Macrococcus hajekii]
MTIDYNWVKNERQNVLAQISNLSESEFSYNFGFGEGSIKRSLLAIADGYRPLLKENKGFSASLENFRENEHTLSLEDVKQYFHQIDDHINSRGHNIDESIAQEFRRLGHIDIMLHIIDQEDHRIAERTNSRKKVTERLNMTITRL